MPTTPETASTPDTSTAAVPGHPTGGTHPSAAFRRLTGSLGALPQGHPLRAAGTLDAPLLQALTGRAPDRRPVWFMRQAGRSLPEYRSLRQGTAMLDACLDPAMAAEITLQPVRRHDVDAASKRLREAFDCGPDDAVARTVGRARDDHRPRAVPAQGDQLTETGGALGPQAHGREHGHEDHAGGQASIRPIRAHPE